MLIPLSIIYFTHSIIPEGAAVITFLNTVMHVVLNLVCGNENCWINVPLYN